LQEDALKKNYLHLACTILMLALAVSISFGGGYQLNEHGARAVGMGGAFVARASDGSAIYFNPAGLGFQKGFGLMLGTTMIMPSTTWTPQGGGSDVSMKSQTFFPSNFYASYSVGENWVFGLGFFTPYGLGTEWPDKWNPIGMYEAEKTNLQTYYINPTVAYKVNDKLSFGVGVSYIIANATLRQYALVPTGLPSPPYPAFISPLSNLDGKGNGVSVDLGVLYKATDKLSFGASYRSLAKIDFSGTASFSGVSVAIPSQDGSVTLPMPSNFYLGAAYQVSPALTVEGDFQWVGWSSYDQLALKVGTTTTTLDKKWDDGYLFRLGGEYNINDKLTLRAGYIADISPQPPSRTEPMLPDANRNDISIGGGYKITEKLNVDLAYMIVLFNNRDASTAPAPMGTYKSSANLVSIDFGYQF
jgi:long-chain fatty acid transport protein